MITAECRTEHMMIAISPKSVLEVIGYLKRKSFLVFLKGTQTKNANMKIEHFGVKVLC